MTWFSSVDNPDSVTGGDNLIALNNLFLNSTALALKNVDAGSIAAYNSFWNNAADYQGSNIDLSASLLYDPLLNVNYYLKPGSPAIDAGAAHFEWNGESVLNLPPSAYFGAAPDLGAYEFVRSIHLPLIRRWMGEYDSSPQAHPNMSPDDPG